MLVSFAYLLARRLFELVRARLPGDPGELHPGVEDAAGQRRPGEVAARRRREDELAVGGAAALGEPALEDGLRGCGEIDGALAVVLVSTRGGACVSILSSGFVEA
jgi:hypothetical protein